MPNVLEFTPQHMTGLHGQVGMLALDGLHPRQLIQTDGAFAFMVMADPISSVAYAIEAALRALQGNLGLLLPTMALVIGVIALVTINYHQLSGWFAGDGPLLVRGAQTPVAAGERPGCSCSGLHTRDEPAAWMAVDLAWSSRRDRCRAVPAVGAGRMPSGNRLGGSTG